VACSSIRIYDLESRFGIDRRTLKLFLKENVLKPRVIPGPAGGTHLEIFLIKDNKDTLPPKKLTESRLVAETKDGKTWHHSEPWYRFVEPHVAFKDYKIMNHLRVVPPEEVKAREEAKKKETEEKIRRKSLKKR
jgi:hypothetical protein